MQKLLSQPSKRRLHFYFFITFSILAAIGLALFTNGNQAHAANLPTAKDYGISTKILVGQPRSMNIVPNSVPGVSQCVFAYAVVNPTGGPNYNITFKITNNCTSTLSNINWYIDGTIDCAGQPFQGISVGADNIGSLGKGQFKTLYSASRSSNCYVDGISVPNTQSFQFFADGDITTGVGQTPSTYRSQSFS